MVRRCSIIRRHNFSIAPKINALRCKLLLVKIVDLFEFPRKKKRKIENEHLCAESPSLLIAQENHNGKKKAELHGKTLKELGSSIEEGIGRNKLLISHRSKNYIKYVPPKLSVDTS